jgi:TIR domain-containing protein
LARIHIAENHKDADIAQWRADGLSRSGHNVSLDRNLIPGDEWQRALRQALLAADGLIVVLSENSVDHDKVSSQWVAADIGAARATGKFLIPVIIGDVPIPTLVSDIYAVPLRERSEQELERGVPEIDKAIRTHIERREAMTLGDLGITPIDHEYKPQRNNIYKKYVELGYQQHAFFSKLNAVKRLYVFIMEIRIPLLVWISFALGLALPRFLLWSFAYAADISPSIFNREYISLLFFSVLLLLILCAFIVSVYIMLFMRNPSRQSIESAKFFAGFVTGVATQFLSPVLSSV